MSRTTIRAAKKFNRGNPWLPGAPCSAGGGAGR